MDPITLITPKGLIPLNIPQKYSLHSILNLDDINLNVFIQTLQLFGKYPRYEIVYTLMINDLLIEKLTSEDESVLFYMETHLQSSGTSKTEFNIDNLKIEGPYSSIFQWIRSLTPQFNIKSPIEFKQSFYLNPNLFTYPIHYQIDNCDEKRYHIRDILKFGFRLDEETLIRAFILIDKIYFNELLKYRIRATGYHLRFRVSTRMTRTAGSLTVKRNQKSFKITIAAHVHSILNNQLVENSGLIDCFLTTLQHEIVHLIVHIEMIRLDVVSKEDIYQPHGLLFQQIAERFFGLNKQNHQRFDMESPKPNFKLGELVSFRLKKQYVSGKVIKLNPKRAQVKLRNDNIYNVPYTILTK